MTMNPPPAVQFGETKKTDLANIQSEADPWEAHKKSIAEIGKTAPRQLV